MAKRKGRDISGWIVIDKPAGITSNAVVGKVRWAFNAKKAGHAGTLDPAATGVLAVALGEATKTVPYVTEAMKAYTFTVRLGAATNTDDADGTVIATSDRRPQDREIVAALKQFEGEVMQVPPAFSAVKIDGQRAYARARAGEDIALMPRPLFVEKLNLEGRPDDDHAILQMVCGKGGYVRAIARDLGEALGCLAHVAELRRDWSGPFDTEDGVTIEQIEKLARAPELDTLLAPLEIALSDLPEVRCAAEVAGRLRNGNPVEGIATDADYGDEAWASVGGKAMAIGNYRAGMFHPSRVILQ